MNFKEYLLETLETDNIKSNSIITVYHGTSENEIKKFLIGGVDASKVQYRHYNQGRERGLYVTNDIKVAKSFGNWIIEFDAKGKDLFPTRTFGAYDSDRRNKELTNQMKKKYPNSFRPWVSYMFDNKSEPQAMFLGYLSNKKIKKYLSF